MLLFSVGLPVNAYILMSFITLILYSLPQTKTLSHCYDGLTDPTHTSLISLIS